MFNSWGTYIIPRDLVKMQTTSAGLMGSGNN